MIGTWVRSSTAEQWTLNPLVLGSNPRSPTIDGLRPKGAEILKTQVSQYPVYTGTRGSIRLPLRAY